MRSTIVAPLPNPADVATRQREQTATIAHANGSRILWVHALEDGMVVLEEADGTVIDEAVPWMGAFDPIVGDKVIRLTIPGRGSKHAAPAYVVIGPVKASALTGRSLTVQDVTVTGTFTWTGLSKVAGGATPSLAVGAALGTGGSVGVARIWGFDGAAQVNCTAGTTSLTTGTVVTITFATPRAGGDYVPILTRISAGAADTNIYVISKSSTAFAVACRTAPTSGQLIAFGYEIVGTD